MGGYLHLSQPHVIVDLFKQMRNGGFEASLTTVLYLLSAIGDLGSYLGGEALHGYCIKMGFSYHLQVVTALINMYAKNGQIDLARRIFDGVAVKDVVLWNCLVDKYAKHGRRSSSFATADET